MSDWPALMAQRLLATPPSPKDARPDLPQPAAAAILKALAKDPERRFQSAGAFAVAFAEGRYAAGLVNPMSVTAREYVSGAAPATRPIDAASTPHPQRRSLTGAAVTGVVIGAIIIALIAGMALEQPKNGVGGVITNITHSITGSNQNLTATGNPASDSQTQSAAFATR